MKYLKKKKRKKNYGWVLAAAVVCVVLAVLVMWLFSKPQERPDESGQLSQPTNAPAQESASAAQPEQETVPETQPESVADCLLETPCCTLRLPGQWANSVTMELIDGNAVFYGDVSGRKVELYTFFFGEVRGVCIGFLQNQDGGNTAVSLLAAELPEDISWSPEEADSFYAMQESMNDVALALSDEPGFVPFE